jgi:hypothetical protein
MICLDNGFALLNKKNLESVRERVEVILRGIEVKRYRLRQRLGLQTEENLVEFIMRF